MRGDDPVNPLQGAIRLPAAPALPGKPARPRRSRRSRPPTAASSRAAQTENPVPPRISGPLKTGPHRLGQLPHFIEIQARREGPAVVQVANAERHRLVLVRAQRLAQRLVRRSVQAQVQEIDLVTRRASRRRPRTARPAAPPGRGNARGWSPPKALSWHVLRPASRRASRAPGHPLPPDSGSPPPTPAGRGVRPPKLQNNTVSPGGRQVGTRWVTA